jgi:hypothetical protein
MRRLLVLGISALGLGLSALAAEADPKAEAREAVLAEEEQALHARMEAYFDDHAEAARQHRRFVELLFPPDSRPQGSDIEKTRNQLLNDLVRAFSDEPKDAAAMPRLESPPLATDLGDPFESDDVGENGGAADLFNKLLRLRKLQVQPPQADEEPLEGGSWTVQWLRQVREKEELGADYWEYLGLLAQHPDLRPALPAEKPVAEAESRAKAPASGARDRVEAPQVRRPGRPSVHRPERPARPPLRRPER